MQVYKNFDELANLSKPLVIALGNFDGVHLGHQQLLTSLADYARNHDAEPVVVTFYPHPLEVIKPGASPKLILPLEEKLNKISALGIKRILLAPFTKEFAQMTAHQFITDIIVSKLQVIGIFVGYNYTFGAGGEGNPETLAEFAQEFHYFLHITPPVEVGGVPVSSSKIRERLATGQVAEAGELLGYLPFIAGPVVHGEQRGRTIGFPTANLNLESNQIYPASGVYAVKVMVEGSIYFGVANIGTKPTFHIDNQVHNLEVHILDFEQDIYGREIKVEFIQRLRGETTFGSVADLLNQITADVESAKAIFAI